MYYIRSHAALIPFLKNAINFGCVFTNLYERRKFLTAIFFTFYAFFQRNLHRVYLFSDALSSCNKIIVEICLDQNSVYYAMRLLQKLLFSKLRFMAHSSNSIVEIQLFKISSQLDSSVLWEQNGLLWKKSEVVFFIRFACIFCSAECLRYILIWVYISSWIFCFYFWNPLKKCSKFVSLASNAITLSKQLFFVNLSYL